MPGSLCGDAGARPARQEPAAEAACAHRDALAALGRRDEARALFESLLGCRNRHGLLAEHVDPATRELWGNFPQTYSMVGMINSATRLSLPWDQAF